MNMRNCSLEYLDGKADDTNVRSWVSADGHTPGRTSVALTKDRTPDRPPSHSSIGTVSENPSDCTRVDTSDCIDTSPQINNFPAKAATHSRFKIPYFCTYCVVSYKSEYFGNDQRVVML